MTMLHLRRFLPSVLAILALVPVAVAAQTNTRSIRLHAAQFQAIAIENSGQAGLGLQPGFTIEAWIKLASEVPAPGNYVIASRFDGAPAGASFIFRVSNTQQAGFDGPNINLVVGTDNGTSIPTLGVAYAVPVGQWHHVAVTYDTFGTAEFFVDGQSIGTVTGGPTSMWVGDSGFGIGAFTLPPSYPSLVGASESEQFFDGWLDEVRVWNTVQTREAIAANMSSEISGSTQNLVAYWQLNGDLDDESMNHNNLMNFGASFSEDVPSWGVLNTSPGSGVAAAPTDTTTGSTPVSVTFASVSQGGSTTLTTSTTVGPIPPPGFSLGEPAVYYDLTTTAVFGAPVAVCVDYSEVSFAGDPALFHFENGTWVNRTSSLDTANRIVCASVNSLSPFAVFGPRVPKTKDDCKGSAWQTLKGKNGTPFKNQGACVSYVNTGK